MCLVNRVKDILADFMNCVRHLPDNPDNPETPDNPVTKVFSPAVIPFRLFFPNINGGLYNLRRHLPDNPDNPETPDSPVPKVFIPIIILIKNRIIPFS